ncbi:MAG: hypothetical protein LQ347_005179, partial [Umbilicaria vellea]
MSTAKRGRGQSLHLELPSGISEDLPPVAATFLILFDIKAGYTIVWKQSIPGLKLTDSVEFKSLPSGLHNVKEDLIYFLHDDTYAGISAFINEPATKSERNALMLAVGVLVPLSQGRLGRSWEHAQGLKDLARELAQDTSKTQPLEDFWDKHRWRDAEDSGQSAVDHESSSIYDLSVLSNIPAPISELLPLEPLPIRLQPLFSVGVHDIPTLHHGSRTSLKPTMDEPSQDLGYGWVACTTDDVLTMKESLYDYLVTIPPPYTAQAKEK